MFKETRRTAFVCATVRPILVFCARIFLSNPGKCFIIRITGMKKGMLFSPLCRCGLCGLCGYNKNLSEGGGLYSPVCMKEK